MPFEIFPPDVTAPLADDASMDAESFEGHAQLPLRLTDGTQIAIGPIERRAKPSLHEIHAHVTRLSGQLDTLRRQLRDHPADRLAILLREMIDERERELDRWLAQEQRWDERLAAIERAIDERDAFRAREAELTRQRDDARRQALANEARLGAAERDAEEAKRRSAAMERAAEKAQAEQLRLRQEREADTRTWHNERRQMAAELERINDRGWLSRIIRG